MERRAMINFLHITKHLHIYHKDKSKWALGYCKDIKDRPEIRKLITEPRTAYRYCRNIKDRKEIRKLIIGNSKVHSYYSYLFCKTIKDRKEIRDSIRHGRDMGRYLDEVREDKQIRQRYIEWNLPELTKQYRDKWDNYGKANIQLKHIQW
jgi:hypothetical protein